MPAGPWLLPVPPQPQTYSDAGQGFLQRAMGIMSARGAAMPTQRVPEHSVLQPRWMFAWFEPWSSEVTQGS